MNRASEALVADRWLLEKRLLELGLRAGTAIEVHENATVMVSVSSGGKLRLHRGYAYAPDRVLEAVVTFVTPGTPRRLASRARRSLLEFPVARFAKNKRPAKRRPVRIRPTDRPDLRRLKDLHAELNALHFDSCLAAIPVAISHRMKRKLGEITIDSEDRVKVITIGRIHIDRDGWDHVRVTLLHEMVHQWQAESRLPVDHGAEFKRKARAVGIPAAATRYVRGQPGGPKRKGR